MKAVQKEKEAALLRDKIAGNKELLDQQRMLREVRVRGAVQRCHLRFALADL